MENSTLKLAVSFFAFTGFLAILFVSCDLRSRDEIPKVNPVKEVEFGKLQVLEIDRCEYVVWNYFEAGGIVHKQNCKYCLNRNNE